MSRYHLCIEALRRGGEKLARRGALIDECQAELARHRLYVREHVEDMPEVRDWPWTGA